MVPATDERTTSGVWAHVRSHPVRYGVLTATAVAVAVVVLYWFQPQTLLFDRVVDEEFPTIGDDDAPPDDDPGLAESEAESDEPEDGAESPDVVPDESGGGEQAPDEVADDEPVGPQAVAAGRFESRNRYTVEGSATVYALEDGTRVLRLEEFSSTNGPDLFVYLTSSDVADSDDDLNADFVDLGGLTGNIGDQNYEIPDDVDLDRYDTAVIWCRRFTVGFGAADLHPAE